MALSPKKLLINIDELTEDEIESYFDQKRLRRLEAAVSEELDGARASLRVAQAAADEVDKAKPWASAALIFAAGAMLAAVASAVIAFMALRDVTISG